MCNLLECDTQCDTHRGDIDTHNGTQGYRSGSSVSCLPSLVTRGDLAIGVELQRKDGLVGLEMKYGLVGLQGKYDLVGLRVVESWELGKVHPEKYIIFFV